MLLKKNRENYTRKCFWAKEKGTRVKFNPGLSANRPSNNWAQEDMIKCALHIKIESKITMSPIYNFEFTIKCEDVYYMKH